VGDGGTEPTYHPAEKDINYRVIITVQIKYKTHGKDNCPNDEAGDAPCCV
jgi:hypothetical protein